MKIAVVGEGAMDSLFAGHPAGVNEDVWLYYIWEEHVQAICEKGLQMSIPHGIKTIPSKRPFLIYAGDCF